MKLRAPEAAGELDYDAPEAAVFHEQVVAAADHLDGQLFPFREQERVADVVHVLRHDEDVGRPANPKRRVEAQGFLEPHFPPDLS